MPRKDFNDKAHGLLEVLSGKTESVFSKRFKTYLFFDLDIRSDAVIIGAVKEIVTRCLGPASGVAVFSYTKRTLLGWLEPGDDWLSKITVLTDRLVQSGDYNGLVLIDSSLKYAVYQARPIDLGIFAFDEEPNWELLSVDTRDCFIRVRDIESWLNDNSEGNASLASFYGRHVLEALIRNYS